MTRVHNGAVRRVKVAALLLFLLGFPLFGTLYVYFHAHGTMRASAKEFVNKDVADALRDSDYETIRFLGTLTLKNDLSQEEFEGWMKDRGSFQGFGDLRPSRSTVGTRADQSWQFVDLEGPARFEQGEATVRIRAARRSTALMEWRLESLEIVR